MKPANPSNQTNPAKPETEALPPHEALAQGCHGPAGYDEIEKVDPTDRRPPHERLAESCKVNGQ